MRFCVLHYLYLIANSLHTDDASFQEDEVVLVWRAVEYVCPERRRDAIGTDAVEKDAGLQNNAQA